MRGEHYYRAFPHDRPRPPDRRLVWQSPTGEVAIDAVSVDDVRRQVEDMRKRYLLPREIEVLFALEDELVRRGTT